MAKKVTILLVVLVIVSGFLYLFLDIKIFSSKSIPPEVAVIKERGRLIVGMDATYPPLEYLDENGQVIGFGADLASEIARAMDVPLESRNITFDKIFDALENGEIDMIISSLTITSDRQEIYDFSNPYLNAGQVLVVQNSNNSILAPEDLEGNVVGVQHDTTSAVQAEKYTSEDLVNLYPDYEEARKDLLAGKIDAIIIDYPAGVSMAQSSGGALKVVGSPFTSEFYGVVFPKNKLGLVNFVNKVISNLKSTGKLNSMERLWLKR